MLESYLYKVVRLRKCDLTALASRLVCVVNRCRSVAFRNPDFTLSSSLKSTLSYFHVEYRNQDDIVKYPKKVTTAYLEGGRFHHFYWVLAFCMISLRDELVYLCKYKFLDSSSIIKSRSDISTLSKISPVFAKFTSDLTREKLKTLLKGKNALASIQERHLTEPCTSSYASLSENQYVLLDTLVQLSTASYGWRSLYFYGLGNWRMIGSNRRAIQALTGISKESIITIEERSELYRPGYFIVLDHANRRILVTIRGTTRVQDCITGLTCTNVPFQLRDSNSKLVEGYVHEGFYQAAAYLNSTVLDIVKGKMLAYPDYAVVTVGHSLGGACAAIMTLLWTQLPEFEGKHLKSYSFGSPGVVCESLTKSENAIKHITSVIHGDDVVPRMSLASFENFCDLCYELGKSEFADTSEVLKRDPKYESSQSKLYPCGKCYHIPHASRYGTTDRVLRIREIDPTSELKHIILSPKMFSSHWPKSYLNAIRMQSVLTNHHSYQIR